MLYFFTEKTFSRNQVIYSEGQENIDGIYFIKSGEFDLSKKVNRKVQTK